MAKNVVAQSTKKDRDQENVAAAFTSLEESLAALSRAIPVVKNRVEDLDSEVESLVDKLTLLEATSTREKAELREQMKSELAEREKAVAQREAKLRTIERILTEKS